MNKNRDLFTGYTALFGGGFPIHNIVAMLLAPFAASVEVFIRKDMGQRYFTYGTFIAGLIVIGLFRVFQFFANIYTSVASTVMGWDTPINEWLYRIWIAYILMGSYHFFYQWYRERTNKPVLSHHLGDSRLFFLGKVILAAMNRFISIPVKIMSLFLPKKDREALKDADIRFKDYQGFTYAVVEPLTVFIVGFAFSGISSLLGLWLMISGLIVAIHSSALLAREKQEILDLRDSQIMASQFQPAMKNESDTLKLSSAFRQSIHKMAAEAKGDPNIIEAVRASSPTVAAALEMINRENESDD